MRILVTGASGFIGSHLVPELEQEHQVVMTDRMDADLSQSYEGATLIRDLQPDYVVHLAARYGRILCRDEPHRAVADNAAATTEIAAVCAELGVPVLYASSSEVYGDHGQEPITEDSQLRTPTTIYGLSKRWGEEALRLYLPPEQLCVVRLNMLYGPEQRGGYGCCALATFIRDALEGKPLTVHRGASRSWLYISDAVRALAMLVGRSGVWNLGNPSERLTMVQTAEIVCEEVGTRALMEYVEPPLGQIRHKCYVSDGIQRLGWAPKVGLREGVRQTVAWAKANEIRDYAGVI